MVKWLQLQINKQSDNGDEKEIGTSDTNFSEHLLILSDDEGKEVGASATNLNKPNDTL